MCVFNKFIQSYFLVFCSGDAQTAFSRMTRLEYERVGFHRDSIDFR